MQENKPRKRGSTATRRRGARQKAMQALYQWDFDQAAQTPEQVVQQFCEMQNMDRVDVEYFTALFTGAAENVAEIDAEIGKHLDRDLKQLDPIERSVLRICCVELKDKLETPYKVIVNEALEISKDFGADKGYRYINGIADKLAMALRSIEYTRDHPDGNPLSEKGLSAPVVKTNQSKVKISVKEKPDNAVRSKVRQTAAEKKPVHSAENTVDDKPAVNESIWGGKAKKSNPASKPEPRKEDNPIWGGKPSKDKKKP